MMFPAAVIAANQNKLPSYHAKHVPDLEDRAGWESFIAWADEHREVIFALHHPNGFKKIHELLPAEEWMFILVPRLELPLIVGSYLNTIQYPKLTGYWVVDWT